MSSLSFWRGGALLAQIDDAQPGDMLLDVARFHEVPLHWRCGQGTCGACLVYLQHAGQPGLLSMGGKERNVLARKQMLTEAERQADRLPDTPLLPRLACHVVLVPGVLKVHW